MLKKQYTLFLMLVIALAGTWASSASAEPGVVKGWIKAGNNPAGYEIGTAKMNGRSVAFIKSVKPEENKFGTLMQSFLPDDYLGQRIRLTAMIHTVDVDDWVGMWMRVDKDHNSVAFDNMQTRPLKGTTDWKSYSIVLDVPQGSDNISMGLILSGAGEAYWDDLKLEIVGQDVPVTSGVGRRTKRPSNLGFEN